MASMTQPRCAEHGCTQAGCHMCVTTRRSWHRHQASPQGTTLTHSKSRNLAVYVHVSWQGQPHMLGCTPPTSAPCIRVAHAAAESNASPARVLVPSQAAQEALWPHAQDTPWPHARPSHAPAPCTERAPQPHMHSQAPCTHAIFNPHQKPPAFPCSLRPAHVRSRKQGRAPLRRLPHMVRNTACRLWAHDSTPHTKPRHPPGRCRCARGNCPHWHT